MDGEKAVPSSPTWWKTHESAEGRSEKKVRRLLYDRVVLGWPLCFTFPDCKEVVDHQGVNAKVPSITSDDHVTRRRETSYIWILIFRVPEFS